MRCKQGDIAVLIKSLTNANIGKYVTVSSYLGFFNAEDTFENNGITSRVPITDHYWWITCPSGLETPYGPMSKAVCPDTWLKPIPPDLLDDDEETGDSVYNTESTTADV